jgi:hypothetical protein
MTASRTQHPQHDASTIAHAGTDQASKALPASDPKSPDHVCTAACTHERAKLGTVHTTDSPTQVGAGSPRAR